MSIDNARTQPGRPAGPAQGERPLRSLLKAISWRVTGSVDTMLLSWLFTGDLRIAAAIGLTEVATKTVLYYLHERAWNRVALGRHTRDRSVLADGLAPLKESA
jgi:uncharacterized membrane protein